MLLLLQNLGNAGGGEVGGSPTMRVIKIRHWHRSWTAMVLALLKWMN